MADVSQEHQDRLIAIGALIKAAREEADMSLSQVHASSGVYKSSLSRIENGVRDGKPCAATVPTLYRIAKAVGRHPAQFFATIVTAPPLQGEDKMASLVRRNVEHFREAAGMTRRELGAEIGSSQDVIARIEDKDHQRALDPTTVTLMRIADGLEIPLVRLFLPTTGYRYRDAV